MEGGRNASAHQPCVATAAVGSLSSWILCVSAHAWEVSEEQREGEGSASTEPTFSLSLGHLLAPSLWGKLNYWKMFSSDPVDSQETLRGDGSVPDFCGALLLMTLSPNHGSVKYARKSGFL